MVAGAVYPGIITLPHELGHAFFLYHPFQGSNAGNWAANADCNSDGDHICDTDPITVSYGEGRTGINSCTDTPYNDNTENNYMSYTCCQNNLFTENQKARMQQTAISSPVRDTLCKSTVRQPAGASTNCGFQLHLDGKLLQQMMCCFYGRGLPVLIVMNYSVLMMV